MASVYRTATFMTSAEKLEQCPPDEGFEVAFAGRSNAGKSSAINTLTDHNGLARTSKTPGRTQLINFFSIDEERRIVDLPGYGYAKVPEATKLKWQRHLSEYLQKRRCLRGLVLLMDIRHPLQDFDLSLLDWAETCQLPVHILLTKADKLKPNAGRSQVFAVRKQLQNRKGPISVQTFSSLKKQGTVELSTVLDSWYAFPPAENS